MRKLQGLVKATLQFLQKV